MERLKAIRFELKPQVGVILHGVHFELPSFSAVVEEQVVTLSPSEKQSFSVEQGLALAQYEIAALVAVLSSESSGPLSFSVLQTQVENLSNELVLQETVRWAGTVSTVWTPAGDSLALLQRMVQQAASDPILKDLLELLSMARIAPNPRPVLFNMIERLEQKYGGAKKKGKRKRACAAIGIEEEDLKPITANQSSYIGDRHARQGIGTPLDPIPGDKKLEALRVGKRILEAYQAANRPS